MGRSYSLLGAALAMTQSVAAAQNIPRPPQSGFFCIGASHAPASMIDTTLRQTAQDLHFKVSKAVFPSGSGMSQHYELYGIGISLFVENAMNDAVYDPQNPNYTSINSSIFQVQAVQTGAKRDISFETALTALKTRAEKDGLRFWAVTDDHSGNALCGTRRSVPSTKE